MRVVQDFLEKYMHEDYAYIITCLVYYIFMLVPLCFVGYCFDMLPFVFIYSFFFNNLRNYTSGFHMKTNYTCLLYSILFTIIFGYIAKQSTNTLWVVFFIAFLSCRDIYEKAPLIVRDVPLRQRWYNCKPFSLLKLDTSKYDKEYDLIYYKRKIKQWLAIVLIASTVLTSLDMPYYASCALWSVIMCNCMLILNNE